MACGEEVFSLSKKKLSLSFDLSNCIKKCRYLGNIMIKTGIEFFFFFINILFASELLIRFNGDNFLLVIHQMKSKNERDE